MNLWIGKGRLTKKPELRYTTNDKSVCTFTVAINREFQKDTTDFLNCVAWGKTGELINQYMDKGSEILLEGSVQTSNYEKEGQKIYKTEIHVDKFEFCGSGKKTEEQNEKAITSSKKDLDSEPDLPF